VPVTAAKAAIKTNKTRIFIGFTMSYIYRPILRNNERSHTLFDAVFQKAFMFTFVPMPYFLPTCETENPN
jgi:hypothetical protein